MTTLLVDFDCLFERSIRYGPDEVESVLDQHACVYQKLSEATLFSNCGGSDLKRIWVWSNDTDAIFSKFDDGPPADIDIRLEVAKLRAFLEAARDHSHYESLLYPDAKSAILDWENAGFSFIVVGQEPADRMRTALAKVGILKDYPCRRLVRPFEGSVHEILVASHLDQNATAFVGCNPRVILELARKLFMMLIYINSGHCEVTKSESTKWIEVGDLSGVLSAVLSAKYES